MKVFDEKRGKVVDVARTNNDPKPYPICGAKNGSGFDCGHQAGWGTDHKGVGRCKHHGGTTQTISSLMKKKGLMAAVTFPGIQEEFERLQDSRDVFDLRDHIHLIEAVMMTVLKSAKTVEDLPLVAKLANDAAKVVYKLNEIENGRKLVIEVPEVKLILAKVTEVVFRHIPDSRTRDRIGRDILEISVGGASVNDSPVHPALESGLAMESRSGFGEKD